MTSHLSRVYTGPCRFATNALLLKSLAFCRISALNALIHPFRIVIGLNQTSRFRQRGLKIFSVPDWNFSTPFLNFLKIFRKPTNSVPEFPENYWISWKYTEKFLKKSWFPEFSVPDCSPTNQSTCGPIGRTETISLPITGGLIYFNNNIGNTIYIKTHRKRFSIFLYN